MAAAGREPLPASSARSPALRLPKAWAARLQRVIEPGVGAELEEQLALRVRVSNGLAMLNVGVCLIMLAAYLVAGSFAISLSLVGSAVSWCSVFLANRRQLFRASRLLVVLLFLGNILIYVGLLGSSAQMQLMCFAVAMLSCFLFTLDDAAFWVLGVSLSMGVYYFAEPLVRPFFPAPSTELANPASSSATTFIELALLAYVFAHESRRSFRALRAEARAADQARALAQSAARTKTEFLATMSHELRTPLNGVIGMTQLLERSPLSREQRDQLRTLSTSSDYLMSLLDGVLDFTKAEVGRMELDNAAFELAPAITSVAALVHGRAEQKGVSISVRIADDCPRWVYGDQRRLQQVLFNLIGNGIKFTSQGAVDIEVRCAGAAAGEARMDLELEVRDTGIGMSEAELERIFKPFMQANPSISRRFGGTGLGLAISQSIVQLMGGTLSVSSRVGAGSRFVAKLPFQPHAAPVRAEPEPRRSTANEPNAPLGLRVLLAEDNAINQKVVGAFLKVLGCKYEVAADGRAALALLADQPFDVILMDIQMPELDGVGATQLIRDSGKDYAQVPILALTANVLDSERERCQAAGMNGYLTKPLVCGLLRDALTPYAARSRVAAASS